MVWREDDLLFAGIEAEDSGSVSPLAVGQIGCGIACLHCGIVVRGFVAFGADLHDVAAAVPTVWWKILIPKTVRSRQGDAVEQAVLLSHSLVFRRSVLQECIVSIGGEGLPLSCCLC